MLPCTGKNGGAARAVQPGFRGTHRVLKQDVPDSQPPMGDGVAETLGEKETALSSNV